MIEYRNEISITDYLRLREEVNLKKISRAQAEKALRGSVYIIAAYERDEAIGMARVVGDGAYMSLIVDVMVHPQHQNQKIGTTMLDNIMKTLENSVSEDEIMMVNLMSVPGKESYYERFGLLQRPNDAMGAGMCRWLNAK